jgi:hypothetical protein
MYLNNQRSGNTAPTQCLKLYYNSQVHIRQMYIILQLFSNLLIGGIANYLTLFLYILVYGTSDN